LGKTPGRNQRFSDVQPPTIASTLKAPREPIHKFSPVPGRARRLECSKRAVIAICCA
jgi:hypothetical protein